MSYVHVAVTAILVGIAMAAVSVPHLPRPRWSDLAPAGFVFGVGLVALGLGSLIAAVSQ